MDNMRIWEEVKQPPKKVLKDITMGRLKGMSSISPQWRYQKATEIFGPCGFGWKYSVDRLWLEPGANGEVVAFADVSLFVKIDDVWSDPIPGHGGSRFIALEKVNTPKERLYTSDESYKMAITDALSVAFKALGFGGDVYLSLWDGVKYMVIPERGINENKVADWSLACEEAAEGTIAEFREWWKINQDAITKGCGVEGAALVYEKFVKLGKKKAKK